MELIGTIKKKYDRFGKILSETNQAKFTSVKSITDYKWIDKHTVIMNIGNSTKLKIKRNKFNHITKVASIEKNEEQEIVYQDAKYVYDIQDRIVYIKNMETEDLTFIYDNESRVKEVYINKYKNKEIFETVRYSYEYVSNIVYRRIYINDSLITTITYTVIDEPFGRGISKMSFIINENMYMYNLKYDEYREITMEKYSSSRSNNFEGYDFIGTMITLDKSIISGI